MWLRLRLVSPGVGRGYSTVQVRSRLCMYCTYGTTAHTMISQVQEEPTAGRCIAYHPTEKCSTEAEMTKYQCNAPVP
jgi:hypothetical protein